MSAGIVLVYRAHSRTLSIGDHSLLPATTRGWRCVLYSSLSAKNADRNVRFLARLSKHQFTEPVAFLAIPGMEQDFAAITSMVGNRVNVLHPAVVQAFVSRLTSTQTVLMMVDPNDRIRFITYDVVDPEDIKLMVEKFAEHKLTYPIHSVRPGLQTGQDFSKIPVMALSSSHDPRESLSGTKLIITFTARCTECSLFMAVESAKAYFRRSKPACRPTLLFSSQFNPAILKPLVRENWADMFQATSAIPGIEDPETLDIFAPAEVMAIELADEKIKTVYTWEQYLASH
jgi:hypothetical protein